MKKRLTHNPRHFSPAVRTALAKAGMIYLRRIPAAHEVPAGLVVVHNHVRPAPRLGLRGFRAWLSDPSGKLEPCTCGWAPELGTHYRLPLVPDKSWILVVNIHEQ